MKKQEDGKQIFVDFIKKPFVFFCGAGISVNSNKHVERIRFFYFFKNISLEFPFLYYPTLGKRNIEMIIPRANMITIITQLN